MSSTTQNLNTISPVTNNDNTTSIILGTTISVALVALVIGVILFLVRRRRTRTPLLKSLDSSTNDVGAFAKSFRKIPPDLRHNDLNFHENRLYSNLNLINFNNRSRHDYFIPGNNSSDYSSVKCYGKRSNSSGDIPDAPKFVKSRAWSGNGAFRKYSHENIRVNPLYASGIRRSAVYSSVRDDGYSRISRDSSDDGYSTIPSVVLDERLSFQSDYAVIPHDTRYSIYTVVPKEYTFRSVPVNGLNSQRTATQTSGYIVVNESNLESFREKVPNDARGRLHLATPILRPLNSEYITVEERTLDDEYVRLKEHGYRLSDKDHIVRIGASGPGNAHRVTTKENNTVRPFHSSFGRVLNRQGNSEYVTINENGSIKYLTRVQARKPRVPVPPVVLPRHNDYVTVSSLVKEMDYIAPREEADPSKVNNRPSRSDQPSAAGEGITRNGCKSDGDVASVSANSGDVLEE